EVEFFPGNFSARFGRGTGGVVNVRLRSLEPDQIHGALDVSLLDVGLYLEAPLGDNAAVAVAGRRSYLDAVLEGVLSEDGDTELSTAPEWYDYQLILEARLHPQHRLRLFGIGAFDALELRTGTAADQTLEATSNAIGSRSEYQRVSLQYVYTDSLWTNDLRIGVGRDQGRNLAFGLIDFQFELLEVSLRDEARVRANSALALVFGVDGFTRRTNADVTTIRPSREGDPPGALDLDDERLSVVVAQDEAQLAAYVEAEWTPSEALTIVPGVRVDYFSLIDVVTVDPRVQARLRLHERLELSAGAGLFHQPPFIDEVFEPFGNPDLGPERALHVSLGARVRLLDSLSADVTLFYKDLDQVVSRSNGDEVLANDGAGRVYGLEIFLRQDLAYNLSGWLSYTLSRAERTDEAGGAVRLFDFDQTHLLALLLRYQLPDDWAVGVRWRFNSGTPYTPILGGTFIESEDGYDPSVGSLNSARLGPFHALDARIDKKWYFDQWALTAYLSVSNAYNRTNPQGLAYSYDFQEVEVVGGLPILPILGVEGTF
ncbi:MAG: TonB-dependent receptor, partial [Myxococcota bacterium]